MAIASGRRAGGGGIGDDERGNTESSFSFFSVRHRALPRRINTVVTLRCNPLQSAAGPARYTRATLANPPARRATTEYQTLLHPVMGPRKAYLAQTPAKFSYTGEGANSYRDRNSASNSATEPAASAFRNLHRKKESLTPSTLPSVVIIVRGGGNVVHSACRLYVLYTHTDDSWAE